MKILSAKYVTPESKVVCLEIEGFPIAVCCEIHGDNDFCVALDAWTGAGNIIAAFEPPPQPVPTSVSDRQFFQALAMTGVISQDEALAAVRTGEVPAMIEKFIAALPDADQFPARMVLCGATVFERGHPLVIAFGAALGKEPADIDELFRMAAAL